MLLEKIDSKTVSGRMHKMNPARVDREDERRMLPCRNFLDGFCPRGHRCRFYHPVPSSLPTVIRVPNLPSSFQQNTHFGQYPIHGGHHSLFSLSPTSSRSFMGLSPKLGTSGLGGLGGHGGGSSRYINGVNGFSHGFGNRSIHVPVSPTYSEYEMAYAQEMEIQKEKERRASAPSPETEEVMQNTVFSHIDWKEFLTPGARPPPPTHVPYMSNSPGKSTTDTMDSLESLIRSAGSAKITSPVNLTKPSTFFEDRMAAHPNSEFGHPTVSYTRSKKSETSPVRMQPTGPSPPIIRELSAQQQIHSERVLSAKEELQLKVKQIAKELANEPVAHVQSLDTFFRNYTFQTIPTAPSSEQDLVAVSSDAALEDEGMNVAQIVCDDSKADPPHDASVDFTNPKSRSVTLITTKFNPKVAAFICSADSGICSAMGSVDSSSSVESTKSSDPEEIFNSTASSNEQTSPASS